MTHFTPGLALTGGAMIGAAVGVLWLGIGRIAGISGIAGNAATSWQDENDWRWAFLLGLLSPPVMALWLHIAPAIEVGRHLPLLAASGLLVGIGTQLGSGCTSGHGVCGISRGSPRSIAATLTFMAMAIVVVFLVRHVFHGAV